MNDEGEGLISGVRVYFFAQNNHRHADIAGAKRVERGPEGDWHVKAGGYEPIGAFARPTFLGWHQHEWPAPSVAAEGKAEARE